MKYTDKYLKAIADFFDLETKCEMCPHTLHRICGKRPPKAEGVCTIVAELCRKAAE